MSRKVVKCPSEDLTYKNIVVGHVADLDYNKVKYIVVSFEGREYVFGIEAHPGVKQGEIGFNGIQRKWTGIPLQTTVEVRPFAFDKRKSLLSTVTLEADFFNRKKPQKDHYDTDKMAAEFSVSFQSLPFVVGQPVVFSFEQKALLMLTVKTLEVADIQSALAGGASNKSSKMVNMGVLMANTQVIFEKAEDSPLSLTGKAKGKTAMPSIINPDWDFSKMGIGGLDKEFSAIFRRAFASRVFPPEIVEQLGMKHVKGILLFGPPGTGKTLMARQIGKMLNAREPKLVNGPEILNKYVGESEANVRKLFAEAEAEQLRVGINSGLHMIIFDEIDAICKQRGSLSGSTGVHDTVVNQLLAKIDGVEQLNNILIIGMTNRKDLIDEALLRPGRLEVQMEIGLPDEAGRLQILQIHTAKLKEHNKLASDVDLNGLASETKNFSGAELEGLVRAATTTAMNKLVKAETKVNIDPFAVESFKVTAPDFLLALENDIHPSFGTSNEDLEKFISNGIIMWGPPVQRVMDDGRLLIQQTRCGELISPVSVLLEGCEGSGKTALAANLAMTSDFPFVKVCSPESMIGFTEGAKCQAIKKVFDDAYRSELSCIVVDDIERLIEYVPIGPRFSNTVLQALMVLLKRKLPKGKKLLIIGTTSCRDVLDQMQLLSVFNTVIHVSARMSPDHVMKVIENLNYLEAEELDYLKGAIHQKWSGSYLILGIKKLLAFVEMAVQTGIERRAEKLLDLLEEQCLYTK